LLFTFHSSSIALILHSQVLPSYKLVSYFISRINLEWPIKGLSGTYCQLVEPLLQWTLSSQT